MGHKLVDLRAELDTRKTKTNKTRDEIIIVNLLSLISSGGIRKEQKDLIYESLELLGWKNKYASTIRTFPSPEDTSKG